MIELRDISKRVFYLPIFTEIEKNIKENL